MPLFDEFLYSERFRCSPAEAHNTPRRERAYYQLYASVKDAVIAQQRAEQARR